MPAANLPNRYPNPGYTDQTVAMGYGQTVLTEAGPVQIAVPCADIEVPGVNDGMGLSMER